MVAKKKHPTLIGGFLYRVVCGQFCKIGLAKDPHKRFKALQSWSPFPLKLTIYEVPEGSSRLALELWCQFKLKEFWVGKGEWFEVSSAEVGRVIRQVIKTNYQSIPPWHVLLKQKQETAKKVIKKYNERLAKMSRARWADPKYRRKQSAVSRLLWKDKNYRKQYETPEFRKKLSAATSSHNIARAKDPKFRLKMSTLQKKLWADPAHRANRIKAIKKGLRKLN